MFKKRFFIGLILLLFCITICWSDAGIIKVGMVRAGSIDDKSFNQGTWEGIQKAGAEFKLDVTYIKTNGNTEADYLKEISNLHDAGFKMIFCPGFKMQTAVYQAQQKYPGTKFVQIDGKPHAGDFKPLITKNTVAVIFAEHEAGFLAGVAASIQLKDGEVGFIGGMAVPEVQRFNWGFQQGIIYANDNFTTKIIIKPDNVVYIGTYTDVAAGQQLAAQMFDRGVKAIFCAAGGVGIGCINEARARAKVGQKVWIVGVDRDQYWDGIYEGEKSVVLTSAVKRVDQGAYAMVKALKEGKFPGGQTLVFDAKSKGIGIPENNPNLSKEVQNKVAQVLAELQSGKIIVSDQQGSSIK
ncbi:MAG: BMP family ABC transporter substrate-binding protein [Firmicutes bacterium]|nr:BMP family ABC transporter substrate-binding protein [Bacillota bacterium]